jgi:glutaconyl-CoA/methylmalonyl-CoA decarboxylase subunit gamma
MKKYKLNVKGKEYTVEIVNLGDDKAQVKCNGVSYTVDYDIPETPLQTPRLKRKPVIPDVSERKTFGPRDAAASNDVKAPIPGLITQIMVSEGDSVSMGQVVAKMEAMKMENNILVSSDGIIKNILVKKGDSVLEGDVLMTLEDA